MNGSGMEKRVKKEPKKQILKQSEVLNNDEFKKNYKKFKKEIADLGKELLNELKELDKKREWSTKTGVLINNWYLSLKGIINENVRLMGDFYEYRVNKYNEELKATLKKTKAEQKQNKATKKK